MDVERTALPGIGLRHEFVTERGRRVGVISHRSGRRDLVIYDQEDPDSAAEVVPLTVQEADAIAELLGTGHIVERLGELHRQVEGLVSAQLPVEPGAPFDGRTLGDTQARSRTGASIVAVVRGGEVFASPRPDFRFHARDVIVVIGTADGIDAVARLLSNG